MTRWRQWARQLPEMGTVVIAITDKGGLAIVSMERDDRGRYTLLSHVQCATRKCDPGRSFLLWTPLPELPTKEDIIASETVIDFRDGDAVVMQ